MDGKMRKTIIKSGLGWPNGITIDAAYERIIWTDAKMERIETADFNGENRAVLVQKLPHPYGVTILGNNLYWTDWEERAIYSSNRKNASNSFAVVDKLQGLMDIKAIRLGRHIGN